MCKCNLLVKSVFWITILWSNLWSNCFACKFNLCYLCDAGIAGIQITFQYENDLLEELAFKSFEYDEECLSNATANVTTTSSVVNNVQQKLIRMENDYAKRMKIHDICYKKKLSDLKKSINELNRQMEVSVYFGFILVLI